MFPPGWGKGYPWTLLKRGVRWSLGSDYLAGCSLLNTSEGVGKVLLGRRGVTKGESDVQKRYQLLYCRSTETSVM